VALAWQNGGAIGFALIFFVTFLYQDKKVNSVNAIWEQLCAYYT